MRYNIDFIYKRHNILKVCDIVNITLLKNAYIAYRPTDNSNTNLLRKFIKSTYIYNRPKYAFVIPKCRLNISIHSVHFVSIKLWNKLNTKMKLIKNIKLFIKKLKFLILIIINFNFTNNIQFY